MASLIEFHKWDQYIGQGPNGYQRYKDQSFILDRYSEYLKTILGQEWYDNKHTNPFSHWGPNAHKIECYWNNEDFKNRNNGNGKKKRIPITLSKISNQEFLVELKRRKLFKCLLDTYPYLG